MPDNNVAAQGRATPQSYDVIVVGGGTAGCVLASRLSEDPARSVLLLEAGRAYAPDGFPDSLLKTNLPSTEPPHIWGYQSAPGRPAHSVAVIAGRVLGGGSAINGGIARRARPSDFARWQRHGLPQWGFADALEGYKALENTPSGEDRWHGRCGPWPVRQATMEQMTPPVRTFIDAAAAAGFARIEDFNGATQNGVGPEIKNVENGVRHNAAEVYLPSEVRARPNLSIRSEVQADRIEFENHTATGVHLVGGELVRGREIVLTSGVYGTPAILLRSGIGPVNHLKSLGIEVIAALPVGEHLQDQPMVTLLFAIKPEAGSVPADGSAALWTHSAQTGGDQLDLQLSVSVQHDVDAKGEPMRLLRIWAAVVLPRSVGTVRLKSRDPLVTPRIDYNLLADPEDRRRLVEIVQMARKVVRTQPLSNLIEREIFPGEAVVTDAQLEAAIDASSLTFYHGTSTAPMGGDDDPAAVVDAQGRVRGVKGLRVADASIFPEAISTPTNLTTLLVAERIAAQMRCGVAT